MNAYNHLPPCAWCKAGAGAACTFKGKPLKSPHKSRIDDANRHIEDLSRKQRAEDAWKERNRTLYEQDLPPGPESEGVWHANHLLQGEGELVREWRLGDRAVLRRWILGYGWYHFHHGWSKSARVQEPEPSGRFYWAVDLYEGSPFDEGYCDSRNEAWDKARAALEECWPEILDLEKDRAAREAASS